jgi:hypothetical protein
LAEQVPSTPARRFLFDTQRAPVARVFLSWLVPAPGDRDLIVPRLIKEYWAR